MSRYWQIVLAALVGTFLAAVSNPFVRADEFRDSGTILKGLIPVTGETAPPSIDLDIRFEINSAVLTPEALEQVDALAQALKSPALAEARIAINGHTDATGGAEHNRRLSLARAESVRGRLAEAGIPTDRLAAEGFGEDRLKDPANPNGAANRRVEIVNLSVPAPAAAPEPAAPPEPAAAPAPAVAPMSAPAPTAAPALPSSGASPGVATPLSAPKGTQVIGQ